MAEDSDKEIYLGGIESYEGRVPLWLVIIYAALSVWGIYYLIKYW